MARWNRQFLRLLALASSSYALTHRAVVFDNAANLHSEYGYVVIGGGTSGLVVANRLTEDQKTTVLVIEYGYLDGQENGTSVPGLAVSTEYERNYESVPQPGLDGRTTPVFSGAVVGGAYVINGQFFNRGSALDYDDWEKLGNPGWGCESLLPYFKKSGNFNPPAEEMADAFPGVISEDLGPHGTEGPVGSSFSNFQYPVFQHFFRGWNSIGLLTQPQPNAGDTDGVIYGPVSIKGRDQSRDHASAAYYRPIADMRPDLHLLTGSAVFRILFDENKRASPVEYLNRESNRTSTIKGCKEVILAAGALYSPQILQLSGVGPKSLLSKYGVDVVEDLPGVGANWQDQPSFFMEFNCKYATLDFLGIPWDDARDSILTIMIFQVTNYPFPTPSWYFTNESWLADSLEEYYESRTGPLTIPYFGGSCVAFLPLQNTTNDYKEVIRSAAAVNTTSVLQDVLGEDIDATILAGFEAQTNLTLDLYNSPHATAMEVAWAGSNTIPVAILRPLSRGVITINSTAPSAPPVFNYGTFKHPADEAISVLALKKTRE